MNIGLIKNKALKIDLRVGSLELAMLKNAVLTKTWPPERPIIDIPGVTSFNYNTYIGAKHDFDLIQQLIKEHECKTTKHSIIVDHQSCTDCGNENIVLKVELQWAGKYIMSSQYWHCHECGEQGHIE